MFSAPVPNSDTFAATVPDSGLRASTIGSWAGWLPLASAFVVADCAAVEPAPRSAESDSAMKASADSTARAIDPVAVSGTEVLRVCSQFDQSPLEVAPALDALDGCPTMRHPHRGMVLCDVSGPSSELKVLNAVVVLDFVDVVDVLV